MTTVRPKVLDTARACEYMGGISKPTLHKFMREKKLEGFWLGYRRMFMVEELDRFLEECAGN